MCGIAGVAGSLDPKDDKVFNQLLYLQAFRGIDSTGLAAVNWDATQDVTVLKATVPAPDFLDMERVKKAINGNNVVLFGHARSRTFGDVNKANAQPFDFDHLTGVHNGTLSHGAKIRLEGKDNNFPTDSYALYWHMNERNIDSVMKLTDADDAMALVWFDKRDRTLNFYRNTKRPLWYAFSEDRTRLYWASESGMLYLVLNRNEVKFNKIKKLADNLFFSIKVPEKRGEVFPAPVTRFCHQQKAPPKPAVNAGSRIFYASGSGVVGGSTATGSVMMPVNVNQQPKLYDAFGNEIKVYGPKIRNEDIPSMPMGSNVVPFKSRAISDAAFRLNRIIQRPEKDGGPYYKSESGRHYDEKQFDQKMMDGCAICGVNPIWGEGVRFLPDESFVCSGCMAEAKEQSQDPNASSTTLCLLNHLK